MIGYSVAGTRDDVVDPVEVALLHAADAGVFVSTSAGNAGPEPGTVTHPSPWVTTVAAARAHDFASTVRLGDGQRFVGASVSPEGVGESPLVLAEDAAAPGADPDQTRRCLPGTIDPASVAGAIVVCDRGVNPRVQKGAVVADAACPR